MRLKEYVAEIVAGVAAVLITVGVFDIARSAGLICAGVMLAVWGWLVSGDV